MWGAASFLFRCARCSGTPVWVRGSRSSHRCPYRVAVPPEGGGTPSALGGRRAAPVAPQLRWVRGGGGGAAPPPALGPVWEGGGFGPLAMPPVGRGGGRHGSPGPGGQQSAGGSRPSPAPLYREPDSRWGLSSPGRCRAALAGRGWP